MSVYMQTVALSLGYEPACALANGMELEFKAGELVCLAGPNGSGKSTLLKTLAGLMPPLNGDILLLGESAGRVSPRKLARMLAVVFARFPHGSFLNGYEYVALGRSPHSGWFDGLGERDHQVIAEALRLADAEKLAKHPVDELSDGERQRLSVARALAQEAKIVLLDEPTAFLDLPHRVDLYRMLRELARSRNLCVVMSSHELDLALRFADRMVLLDGKGNYAVGVPEALALEGAITRAFQTRSVRFDLDAGVFVVDQPTARAICCLGEGVEAQWTRKALHRLGYELRGDGLPRIEVGERDGRCCWALQRQSGDECFAYNLGSALSLLAE